MGPLPKTRVHASAATINPAHTPITIAVNWASVMVPKRASPHQDAMPVHTSDSQRYTVSPIEPAAWIGARSTVGSRGPNSTARQA